MKLLPLLLLPCLLVADSVPSYSLPDNERVRRIYRHISATGWLILDAYIGMVNSHGDTARMFARIDSLVAADSLVVGFEFTPPLHHGSLTSLTVFGVSEKERYPQRIWAKLPIWAESARKKESQERDTATALGVTTIVTLGLLVYLAIGWHSGDRRT